MRIGETRAMNLLRSSAPTRPASELPGHEHIGAILHRNDDPAPIPVLEAPPGSRARSLAQRVAERPPLLVFLLTTLAGYVILAALAIGAGFLLVDALLPVHAIGHNDEAVNTWLARQRSSSLNDASYVGSSIGDIPFIPGLVILLALGSAILRRWRVAGLIVGGILVEVATYRVTSLIVHRERPTVPRLDHLPVNQSYPSGHVAAAFVVYAGLALLITSRWHARRLAVATWAIAIALPLIVALSRMYRGMHHPTDAAAGLLIGVCSLAIALFATRTAGEVARLRAARRPDGGEA
jgi:membrane-associated phospholipid phosphatase